MSRAALSHPAVIAVALWANFRARKLDRDRIDNTGIFTRDKEKPLVLAVRAAYWPRAMTPRDLVRLPRLMALTAGSPEFKIGLIDGPSPSASQILRESITSEVDHRAIMDIRCAAVPTKGVRPSTI
jgi:hypothetical protein